MTSRLLFLGGHSGAGKTTVASCVGARLSWRTLSFGAFVRMKATQAGLDASDLNTLLELGHELTTNAPRQFCSDFIAAYHLRADEGAVLEGLRHPRLVPLFKELGFGQWTRIAFLNAPNTLRARRLLERGEAVPLAVADQHPVDAETEELRQQADYVIDNYGSTSPENACELLWQLVTRDLTLNP